MSKPYVLYLGSKPLSTHATFADALENYLLSSLLFNGHVNIRNAERSDIDDNGLTEDERAQLEAV
jgi:hypothetical protein